MYRIDLLNKISEKGLSLFTPDYEIAKVSTMPMRFSSEARNERDGSSRKREGHCPRRAGVNTSLSTNA